jgi:hypothetical protein
MSKNPLSLAFVCALCACSVPTNNTTVNTDGGDSFDLAGVDLAIGPGSIGAPCLGNGDCTAGNTPSCWKNYILDDPGNLPTPNGYCTSSCTTDADCGSTGSCQAVLPGKNYCVRKCYVANTCRPADGYACFILATHLGYCYPATRLSCNPTQTDPATKNGTCPGQNPPSACIRRTFEDLGECRPLCAGGAGSCSAADGLAQHCIYLDTTRTVGGNPTRDTFKGLACFPVYLDSKKPGGSCNYFEECTDGYECNVVAGGDHICHGLCTVGLDGSCTAPETCHDTFGLGAGQTGLCLSQ